MAVIKIAFLVFLYFNMTFANIFVITSHGEQSKNNTESCLSGWSYNFCDNLTSYPKEEIARLLSEQADYKEYFGPVISPFKETKIIPRFQGSNDMTQNMCLTQTKKRIPEAGRNTNGDYVYIVKENNYIQIIEQEICRNDDDSKCQTEMHNIHLSTTCEQRYSIVRLLAYNKGLKGNSQKIELHSFSVPTGCICAYKHKYF